MVDIQYNNSYTTPFLLILLWMLLGYFIYGGVDGALAMGLLGLLYALSILISLIPFAGIFIQYYVMIDVIFPYICEITGITATWLTTVMFAVNLIFGILVWIIMSVAVAWWWNGGKL
jgi:hypothetical protein